MAKPSIRPGSDVPFIAVPGFADQAVAHGFFGRQGGVSSGVYEGLNCGPGSGDDPAKVSANREKVAKALGADPEKLLSLYQVHGDACLSVTAPWSERPKADAQVTDVPGLALSILTADCAPVLFYGRKPDGSPVIGAAHAGWKGALYGALDSTVAAMGKYGVKPADIRAAIGPSIDKRSYEVGAEFMEEFLKAGPENEKFFMETQKDAHYLFDLGGYCANRLYGLGLTKVFITGPDTYTAERDYFSYRRTTHRKEKDYGRQISAIMIKE